MILHYTIKPEREKNLYNLCISFIIFRFRSLSPSDPYPEPDFIVGYISGTGIYFYLIVGAISGTGIIFIIVGSISGTGIYFYLRVGFISGTGIYFFLRVGFISETGNYLIRRFGSISKPNLYIDTYPGPEIIATPE